MNKVNSTVLIIDDQPGIRRLLVEVFSEEGYHVVVAANGYEGVQAVKEHSPDLILMDMKMPGMDGIETLRELKEIQMSDRVIMMTAYGELDLINQARELGAHDYVTKPFDIITLCQLVGERIATRKAVDAQLIS